MGDLYSRTNGSILMEDKEQDLIDQESHRKFYITQIIYLVLGMTGIILGAFIFENVHALGGTMLLVFGFVALSMIPIMYIGILIYLIISTIYNKKDEEDVDDEGRFL